MIGSENGWSARPLKSTFDNKIPTWVANKTANCDCSFCFLRSELSAPKRQRKLCVVAVDLTPDSEPQQTRRQRGPGTTRFGGSSVSMERMGRDAGYGAWSQDHDADRKGRERQESGEMAQASSILLLGFLLTVGDGNPAPHPEPSGPDLTQPITHHASDTEP
jgi:hypothetical protein